MLKTSFDTEKGEWIRRTTDRLPKHDLYFGSPLNSPRGGLMLGDGDTGSLIWLEKDGLHIHINKCDLWLDAPAGATKDDEIYCSGKEEALTCLLHGGEMTLKFDLPLFDYMYQEKFEARLSFADACARIRSETPFGRFFAEAFSEASAHVTALKCSFASAGDISPELKLFRFGSRNMWRWYYQQKFAPRTGLDGTRASVGDGMLFITCDYGSVPFCIGLAVDGEEYDAETVNAFSCGLRLPKKTEHGFTVYYTAVSSDSVENAKKECRARLENAVKTGADALYEKHRSAWEAFWNASYVAYPDDYVENIYYFWLYCMNSQSRGAYPPHFTRGLWGTYHDFIPWTYYFHYNMQHMYMPLDAAGHGELAENYYAMRRRGLEAAKLYAKRVKGMPGAFYHDVTDRYGRAADYDSDNCTPGAQIAMQMYRHWRYTGDETFLRQTALPVMRETAEFYLGMLKKGGDGLYHIYGTTAYEGNRPTDDTLTDLVMIRALFTALLPFADENLGKRLEDVLAALPGYVKTPLNEDDWDGEFLTRGIGKGRRPFGDNTVFTIGLRGGERVRNMKKVHEYGFPDIELCPLYPAGILGLKDKNTPLFDTLENQILIGDGVGMHWSMYPVYLARMGMAKELSEMQRTELSLWQRFPNGFNAETGELPCPDAKKRFCVTDTDTGRKTDVEPSDFEHFDFETVPIIAQSVIEALLQSHEGVIRLFPAVAEGSDAEFSLFAEGQVAVSAQLSPDGFIATFDVFGDEGFYIALPERFLNEKIFLFKRGKDGYNETGPVFAVRGNEKALDLSGAVKGDRFLLSSERLCGMATVPQKAFAPNADMKECGEACLGSPRLPE